MVFPWTRLSHSKSGKAGHRGVLMMLAFTCLGLADHAWGSLRVARNLGCNSGLKSLFRTIQGRLDSLTFFFLKAASQGSVEGYRDSWSSSDWDELPDDDVSCSTLLLLLPLFEALEVLDSCWSRILINDSIADLMISGFSLELVRIIWISKQISPFLAEPDLNILTQEMHSSTNRDCSLRVPGGDPCSMAGWFEGSLVTPSDQAVEVAVLDGGSWDIDWRTGKN